MSGFAFTQLEPPPAPVVPTVRKAVPPPPEAVPETDPLAQAHAEARAIRAQAHAEGYAAGMAEGQAALLAAAAALGEGLASLAHERAALASELERAAVDLALGIAEQVLSAAVAADPELVVGAVRGALRRLVERDRVLILVNPADLETVREHAAGLVAELGGIEHCEVQAERRVAPGGAVVRTQEGEVDATLATKLDRAREVLERELRGTEG